MKVYFLLLLALFSLGRGQAQSAGTRPDSVTVTMHYGSDNAELHQLMSRVLHIDKLHVVAHNPQLAGRLFHLTYQEVKNGVPEAEKELVGNAVRLLSFDKQGNFAMDIFARQVTETTLENQFLFAAGATEKTFAAQPGKGGLYSLRQDIWPYKTLKTLGPAVPGQQPTSTHTFAVGKKVPFLVYTLPYEADGYLLYCDLAQSKVPVNEWFTKFKISHFVVYNLVVE